MLFELLWIVLILLPYLMIKYTVEDKNEDTLEGVKDCKQIFEDNRIGIKCQKTKQPRYT